MSNSTWSQSRTASSRIEAKRRNRASLSTEADLVLHNAFTTSFAVLVQQPHVQGTTINATLSWTLQSVGAREGFAWRLSMYGWVPERMKRQFSLSKELSVPIHLILIVLL